MLTRSAWIACTHGDVIKAILADALTGADGAISGPPGLGAPFGRPGGLGPPVAELAKVGVSAERLERSDVDDRALRGGFGAHVSEPQPRRRHNASRFRARHGETSAARTGIGLR